MEWQFEEDRSCSCSVEAMRNCNSLCLYSNFRLKSCKYWTTVQI
jgi:hypothetical protein